MEQQQMSSGVKNTWIFIGIITLIIGAGAVYKYNNTAQQFALPAKPIATQDIGKRADDIPSLLTRKENEKVIVELETKEEIAELAPGVTYEYWTYNGTVPGPFIRVKEGDMVEIRLTHSGDDHHAEIPSAHSLAIDAMPYAYAHGPEEESEDAHVVTDGGADEHMAAGHAKHSIDLHAVEGTGGGAVLTQVAPGETHAFQFKATRPGLYVYHCASPHIPTHIANGMYGMILVEPKSGLAKVDREYYVMQGEFYTAGKFGEKGHQEFSLEKLQAERPEYFVFNGRVGSLTGERALRAQVGETIRIFFGVGPHIAANFHVIGAILDTLYPEGDIISPPHRNVQTTIVPPGGAMMTEFKVEVPGKYLLVDHSLSRAIDKGALGELIVDGPEQPEIFQKIR
jgi:nitrite reductase (NO-forming)